MGYPAINDFLQRGVGNPQILCW